MEQSLYLRPAISNLPLVFFGHSAVSNIVNSFTLIAIIFGLVYTLNRVAGYFNRTQQNLTLLQIIPSALDDSSNKSFEDLFSLIHGLESSRSSIERSLSPKVVISFEVVSTYEDGISYIICLPKALVPILKQSLETALLSVVIKERSDYLELNNRLSASRFKLKNPYYFSLKTNDAPGYLGSLGGLDKNEFIALQLVISPLSERFNNKARRALKSKKSSSGWLVKLALFPYKVIKFIANRNKLNLEPGQSKFEQSLYSASLRLIVSGPSDKANKSRLKGFKSALSAYNNPGVQSLVSGSIYSSRFFTWQFKYRMPSFYIRPKLVLSTKELASLYHFPETKNNIEDVNRYLSKTLAVPLALKRTQKFDVVIGENTKGDKSYKIGLSEEERQRHVYVIGGTGNGKTTMLEYMVAQDMKSDKGLAIIDPHGDMAENILKYVPEKRIKDVIYFNPEDIDYPIGLNLLELSKDVSGSDYIKQKDLVVEAVISVLRKIFEGGDSSSAYRIERLLRNAIYSALTVEDATIFTVLRLLSDKYYRWEVIKDLKDENLRRFWQEEYNKAGDFQRIKLSLGPITRLERFERSVTTKRILAQSKSTINFDEILNSGKILVCNLSKGGLGEDTSALLGSVVIAKIQLAAWRRAAISPAKRRPFYLYIDEFQNFASKSYVSLFSEARKYGLSITMAQQSMAQLEDANLVNSLLDNAGTLVAFRSKSQTTGRLLQDQFEPDITMSELTNLPRYNFYAKIAATEPQVPVSGKTILDQPQSNSRTSQKVIAASRKLYCLDYKKAVILAKS